MATHDYIISNASGAAVRADLNNALAAIVSNNSNASSPSTTYAYQWWADTTTSQLKLRNSANNAWITIFELDGTMLMQDGSAAEPSLCFRTDTDTGFYKDGANRIGITCEGVERATFLAAGVIFNDPGNDCNFRVESSGNANMFFVDGGNDRVGVGTASPDATLHVTGELRVDGGSSGVINVGNVTSNYGRIFADSTGTYVGSVTSNPLILRTGNTEAARIDTSGRLLVGTSAGNDSTANSNLVIESNSSGGTSYGGLMLRRGVTAIGSGTSLGRMFFANQSGNLGARINGLGDGTWGSNDYPGAITFDTTADGASSPDEKMRIFSTGQTHHFTTGSGVFVGSSQGAGTTYWLYRGNRSRTNNTSGGSTVFYVYTNGNVQNTNNSYGAISDVKLKENIVDATSQWDDLKALQVRKYNFIEGETHTQLGVIAQEVETVSPGLVNDIADRDEEGNDLGTITKTVNYSVLYMKAVKALQEAMERIETLEAKVAALEAG